MKRKILSRIFDCSRFINFVLILRKIFPRKGALVLCYHRVSNVDLEKFDLMDGVVDATALDFDLQMRFLSRNYNVISLSELVNCIKSKSLPNNAIAITFDDGYRDSYLYAYPILKKYGLPATIFLTVNYINKQNIYWWDRLAYSIKRTKKEKLTLNLNGIDQTFDLSNYQAKLETNKSINTFLKNNANNTQKESCLGYIEKTLETTIPQSIANDLLLNLKDIKEMSGNGIEFGSHTITHPTLTNCTPEELETEIVSSRRILEEKTSLSIKGFAYPSGIFNEGCIDYIRETGYEYACAYDFGICDYNTDIFGIERIDINNKINLSFFKSLMVFPKLMHYSKKSKKMIETA